MAAACRPLRVGRRLFPFPRPDPPGPVRTPQCRLRPAERVARRRPPPPQIRGADTASVMAALGKAGAAGARETWLSRFLTASCAWAKRAEVQIPSGGTRGSSPSVTVNHGLTEGQNRAGTANSAAASAPVAISARWECLATQRVLAPTANPVAAAVQSGWRALLPSHRPQIGTWGERQESLGR